MNPDKTTPEADESWLSSYQRKRDGTSPEPPDLPEAAVVQAVVDYGAHLQPSASFVSSLELALNNANPPSKVSASSLWVHRLLVAIGLAGQSIAPRLRAVYILAAIVLAFVAGTLLVYLPGAMLAIQQRFSTTNNSLPQLLLFDWNSSANAAGVRLIDARTLADVPGRSPLVLGNISYHIISPNGRTLAVIVRPPGSGYAGGELHLVDLVAWTDKSTGITIDNTVGLFTFSTDGKSLFWTLLLASTNSQPFRYDLETSKLTAINGVPNGCLPASPTVLQPLRSGSRLVLYCVPSHGLLAVDAPHVIIMDLDLNRAVADIRLDGVKEGRYPEQASVADEAQPYYGAGLAWDLARNLLYVVHPDADKITVVDLARGTILKQADIRPRVSLLEWLLSPLVSVAEAKGGPATSKVALLSPDGSRLLITGERDELSTQAGGQPQLRIVHLGMQMVATDDLTQIRRPDVVVDNGYMWLTPDGRRALMVPGDSDKGLAVIDTDPLEVRAQLQSDAPYDVFGFSPDSRYAYVNRYAAGSLPAQLQVLDLATMTTIAERNIDNAYLDLLPPQTTR